MDTLRQRLQELRLYAITDERFHPGREMVSVMEQAILGGAKVLQLRDKWSSKREVLEKAKRLRELTAKHQVLFIVNDYIDIALSVDADGVHLGQDDLPLAEARRIIGKEKLIGISTHRIEEARQAEKEGADYLGVGPVFATQTKADVVSPVGLSYVREAAAEITIPWVAIGGIKKHNVEQVIEAGAKRICAVTEIVGADDVKRTCEEFLQKLSLPAGGAS